MKTNYLNKYFEYALENLSKHLNNPDFPLAEKEKLKIRIELINEFKKKSELKINFPKLKQANRIQDLAEMRKIKASAHAIRNQEMSIKYYDLVNITMPSIDAINGDNIADPILDLCNSYDKILDSVASGKGMDLPGKDEIEKAFKKYFDNVALSKYEMFKECYVKIEYFYNELKAISETT